MAPRAPGARMKHLPLLLILALPTLGLTAPRDVRADTLVLADGSRVACEVYKETKSEVRYLLPGKDECQVLAREKVKAIEYADAPVVDLAKFLAAHEGKLTVEQRDDLKAAIAAQAKAAKAEEAKEAKEEKTAAAKDGEPKTGRTRVRSMKEGVKVQGDNPEDVPELVVDPFVEEGVPAKKGGAKDGESAPKKERKP